MARLSQQDYQKARMLVGVDIGGTFTDFVLSVDGRLQVSKRFSTPHDPAQAMLAGLTALRGDAGGIQALAHVVHGSTVATNAILERKGAKAALITTQGFADILAIGRQTRPELYALQPHFSSPLIPREQCYEIPERLDHTGAVILPLDMAALDSVLDKIMDAGVEAIAVCLLDSYVNPVHEFAIRARILQRGFLHETQIALSCEVLPEFREYERASTVALEAYVRPTVVSYLRHLERELPSTSSLRVMKSDGGVVSARYASRLAVQTALSGPAAGVIGAFYAAKLAGFDHIITLDMGGTSTDVSLCPGMPIRYPEREIDRLPLRTSTLDIETIGAGGGSIARVDEGDALRVGPESAGADPGSIIYGRGGHKVTISDAHAVLGRLDSDHFLGGQMKLNVEAARAAIAALGEATQLGTIKTAAGIINIANVKIDQAIRRGSIARGYDPRLFTLVAFGGAGPLHACEVAERLQIPRVLVPRYPGAMCAFGLLTADIVLDYSRSVVGSGLDVAGLQAQVDMFIARARHDLAQEAITPDAMLFNAQIDMRYRGQAYELSIPFGSDFIAAFHAAHSRRYGYAMPGRATEIVNLRLQAIGSVNKPPLTAEPCVDNDGQSARIGVKQLEAAGQTVLYDRDALQPGARFGGSALIFQLDSTTYIPPGWSASVDAYRNILLMKD